MNADGTLNFQGVSWDYRVGTPDQSWIPGFPAVESTHSGDVGLPVEIKRSTPAIRSITNVNANAVRVVVAVGGMVDQDVKTGDAHGTRVDFVIRVRRQGRPGWEAEHPHWIVGKTMSTYEHQSRIPLPGDGPWDIQVERITPDSDRASLRNDTTWASYTEIIDRKLRYPNTALLAITFDARLFGSSMPTVTSRWRTWVVRVPNNYDPVGRNYVGVWNGGWKLAYTSNPAYLFMALLTHRAGCNLPDNAVDMAAIYTCGRYCDEYVPSGLKNSNGSDILEPRFEAHFVHNTRQEAYTIINALASTFRAMAYWAAGAVTVVQDAPRDPLFTVNATQTIGGFEFSGPAVRAIKTVAMVSFLDPDDLDKPSLEVYEDFDLIKKYGWQPENITAFACKSRGQARRLGKWFIETNKLGDTLTYKTSIDHQTASPGDVIVMTERSVVGADLGGRVVTASLTTVQLDRSVTLDRGKGYTLHVQLPDGKVGTRPVLNNGGTTAALNLTAPLPLAPYPEASWVLEISDLRPRKFRIMGVSDDGDMEYTVAAVPYDDTIYARVERGINIKLPPVSKLPNPGIVQPPTNVRVDRQYISTPSGWTTALELRWDPSPDPYIRHYIVRYRRNNNNFETIDGVNGTTKTIYGESTGQFVFHVQAVNIASVESRPAILEVFIPDNSPITLIRPSGLELEGQGNNHVFGGRDPVFVWRGTAVRGSYDVGQEPAVGAGYLDAIFRDYEIRVYDVRNRLVHTDHTTLTRYVFAFDVNSQTSGGPHRTFTFEVRMRDRWGNYSLPAAIEVSNPAPAQLTGLDTEGGYGSFYVKFDRPPDLDYEGAIVWVGEASGFVPSDANVAYDGPNNFVFLQAPPQVTRYIRIAGYDSFGKTGLNVSAELTVRTVGVVPTDLQPPAIPTGLALTDDVLTAPDGTQTYLLKATWTANTEGDFASYGIEIAEEGGNFLHYNTNVPRYEWPVQPGVLYRVRLSAVDREFNASGFSTEVTHTVRGDNEPPAAPTSLTTTASFRSIWVQWTEHPAGDFSHMEVYEAAVNDRAQAQYVANATGTTFLRENLPGGTERWYWIRAVDRSRNKSGFFPASLTGGISARTRRIEEADYAELSIGNAAIANGAIDNAKIASLDAGKIMAGTVLSGEVVLGSTGQTLQQATSGTSDPAAAINTGTTRILPGKITLSGGTTLQNILYGPDQTQINGGAIAANTIAANKLTVGLRGIEVVGVEFSTEPANNVVRWTAGAVVWAGDAAGTTQSEAIAAGSYEWSPGPQNIVYLYWHRGRGAIGGSTDPLVNADPTVVVLGTYAGAARINIRLGRTIIEGSNIRTGSIGADRIQAFSITADQLSATRLITASAQIDRAVVNQTHIHSATILDAFITSLGADKISSGVINARTIQVGNTFQGFGTVLIESENNHRRILYRDGANVDRVLIGQATGVPNRVTDGLSVWDQNGRLMLGANGLGVEIVGTSNLAALATYGFNIIASHTLGFMSVAAGTMHVTSTVNTRLGGSMPVADDNTNQLPTSASLSVRLLLNGATVKEFTLLGWGASVTSFSHHYSFVAPAGNSLVWQIQQNLGGGWTAPPATVECSIVATEYKR